MHHTVRENGESVWLVCRYAEARAVLADTRFSSDRYRTADMGSLTEEQRKVVTDTQRRAGALLQLDPPQHTRYRRLLAGQFTMRRMRKLRAFIEETVTARLDTMLAAGSPADLVAQFAQPVPTLIICELLGVPYADRARFQDWTATFQRLDISVDERHESERRLHEFMVELVRRKRVEPADDIISALVQDRSAHPPLTDVELANIANQLLIGGHETTANTVALGTFALLEHPDQLSALRADPTLIDGAVDELLRFLSIVQLGLFRVTTEDVELAGVRIPANNLVLISTLAANLDARRWPDAATLDISRDQGPHLAFGHGIHLCVGQQLARAEMTIAFTHLLRRLPNLRLAVPADKIPLRQNAAIHGVISLPVAWDSRNAHPAPPSPGRGPRPRKQPPGSA
ncbi:cytochrome P450 [Actinophytocola sp.]|uniref:cytochrome P450 n=1 Tax=Actinophytocola sp. TaxID=1872138 RepID=UPI002D7FBA91|nr:cytochrome P450 [Actinophytocola sp.]HET9141233.1 cytochrome P450 [Actinophytocola sp.]